MNKFILAIILMFCLITTANAQQIIVPVVQQVVYVPQVVMVPVIQQYVPVVTYENILIQKSFSCLFPRYEIVSVPKIIYVPVLTR